MRFDGIIKHIHHFRGQITHTPRFRGIITVEPEPKTAFAIYSVDDNSLTFYKNYDYENITVGGTYKGKTVTGLYTGFETDEYTGGNFPPWNSMCASIDSVAFADTIRPRSTAFWFYNFTALASIDLKNLDTSNVAAMNNMFQHCSALTYLDVTGFDTSNVTTMRMMFRNCAGLTSLNVSNFNTENVTTMYAMFQDCKALTSLDLSSFDTSQVTTFEVMFGNCSALEQIDLNGFNTRNVKKMDGMFQNCTGLTSVDLSSFDTSNCASMSYMFKGCDALSIIDLSSFDTSNVTTMSCMFLYNPELETIYVSSLWSTAAVTTSTDMFFACSKLKGGNGTAHSSSWLDKTYARVDTADTPGYLTLKQTHRYGGVEMLDIGLVWIDKANYPYAIMTFAANRNCPMVVFTKRPQVYQAIVSSTAPFPSGTKLPSIHVEAGDTVYWRRSYFQNDKWTDPTSHYTETDNGHYLWSVGVFWTNHDIEDTSGNIYMAASDPVPMGE